MNDPATNGGTMTESQREALIDKRVQRRLATDNAYRYAETAEEQAQRELPVSA